VEVTEPPSGEEEEEPVVIDKRPAVSLDRVLAEGPSHVEGPAAAAKGLAKRSH
jgi:hypothetical protein